MDDEFTKWKESGKARILIDTNSTSLQAIVSKELSDAIMLMIQAEKSKEITQ